MRKSQNRYVQVSRNTVIEVTPELDAYIRRQKRRRWLWRVGVGLVLAALLFPALRLLARWLFSW